MKSFASIILALILFNLAGESVSAQYRKLTVVLFRHAEKDISEEADTANPELSEAGKQRAERLIALAGKYQPDAIYSTDYIRTRATVRPLARSRRMMTLIYDPRNLAQMRDLILSGKIKRLVIVGHNNTTPALVNMLLGEEKYKILPESEYGKLWVVKIKRNKRKPNLVRETQMTY